MIYYLKPILKSNPIYTDKIRTRGVKIGICFSELITHDLLLKASSEMQSYTDKIRSWGVRIGICFTELITHDLLLKANSKKQSYLYR